jgi:hypothetical protein
MSVSIFVTGVVFESTLLLLLNVVSLLLRNRTRCSRTTVAARVGRGVADVNLGEVVVRIVAESSLESNVLVVVTTIAVGSSGLRVVVVVVVVRTRHFFVGSILFFVEGKKKGSFLFLKRDIDFVD